MKLINLTKLTTSNLLSLLGYPCILLSLYNEFIFFPIDWADYELRRNDSEALGPLSTVTSMFFLIFACFICAAFLILILIEYIIRKKNKNLNFCIEFYSGQDSFLFRLLVLWVCFSCTCFLKHVSTTQDYL